MDCKTARQMLDFARPRRPELDGADLDALEAHLADCPDCGLLAQVERQMDTRLSQAMRAVPIPEDLRARLATKLEMERKTRNWNRTQRWLAVPAAAAALLLMTWLGWQWLQKPTHLDVAEIADEEMEKTFNASPAVVESYFRARDILANAPAGANYQMLGDYYVRTLAGKRVPVLYFTDGKSKAYVYILRTKDFDVAEAYRNQQGEGSGWKAEIHFNDSGEYAYLVIYLGEGEPLKVFPKMKEREQRPRT
jgi:hypothetical protein